MVKEIEDGTGNSEVKNKVKRKYKSFEELIEAFTILKKYNQDSYVLHPEHDIIFTTVLWDDLSEEDAKKLKELGWMKEEEIGEGFVSIFT